jgi:hypothetical protein
MRTVLIGLILLLTGGVAQAAQEVMLYNGDAARDQGGIRFDSWGSGSVSESTTAHYIGPQVLRVLSQGYYQAAVLNFRQPASLTGFLNKDNAYLEMWLKPSIVTTTAPGTAGGNLTGKANFLMSRLRVVLLTDKGEMISDAWPINTENLAPGAWKQVALPLAVFRSPQSEPATQLKGLRISADRADVFYIGQMRLLVDDTPIKLQIYVNPAQLAVGERATFRASPEAGAATTLISWDFDSQDGLQVQAQGDMVEWVYRKTGTFVVTATASDEYGGKSPVSATTMVIVNPGPEQ